MVTALVKYPNIFILLPYFINLKLLLIQMIGTSQIIVITSKNMKKISPW